MDALYWVGQCPWVAAAELASIMNRHVSTINRRLLVLYQDGLVDYLDVGRGNRVERRWCLTSTGVRAKYVVQGNAHNNRDPYRHIHHPLDPADDDHHHPPWWVTKKGAAALYERMEAVKAFYWIFPRVFQEAGRSWHQGEETPHPMSLRWLKHTSLVDAIGGYWDGHKEYRVGLCFVGKHVTGTKLVEKWKSRFSDPRLEWVSEAEIQEQLFNWFANGPNPNHDGTPQLAGYVIVGQDLLAAYQAYTLIPRNGYLRSDAFLWVNMERRLCIEEGLVTPSIDNVADPFTDEAVGRPEDLFPDREEEGEPAPRRPPLPAFMTRTIPLSNVLGTRIMILVAEWSGLTVPQLQHLCGESRKRVVDILQVMLATDLVQVRQGMYYVGSGGAAYVAHLERVHVNSVRARISTDIEQDHRHVRPHRQHTLGRNKVMVEMKTAGLSVYAGWRMLQHIQGVTQIPPDAVLLANLKILPIPSDPLLDGPVETDLEPVFIEYERTARTPSRVQRKLEPYVKAAREGTHIRVAFVCETQKGADFFHDEIRSVYVDEGILIWAMVTTMTDVRKGSLAGGSIWNLWGRPVEME